MNFINKPPEWENKGVEPPKATREEGFKAGYKPPASFFNWFWSLVGRCIKELQEKLSGYAADNDAALTQKADLDQKTGKVPVAQLPAMNYDPAGSAQEVRQELAAHTGRRDNPHEVTLAQVGAAAAGHTHTPAQVGADPAGSAQEVRQELAAHTGRKDNPHAVTADQVGALPLSGGTLTGDLSVGGMIFRHETSGSAILADSGVEFHGGTTQMLAGLNMHGSQITEVKPPVAPTDAANKQYVDTGLAAKAAAGHTHTAAQVGAAPAYSYSTSAISSLPTGQLHLVYE